jgi:multidrug efflux system membrane fusion protein
MGLKVIYQASNLVLMLVDNEDKLESHNVEVIREEGTYFYISSGVSERDRLVKNLPEYPQNGMDVKVLEAPSAAATQVTTANSSVQ